MNTNRKKKVTKTTTVKKTSKITPIRDWMSEPMPKLERTMDYSKFHHSPYQRDSKMPHIKRLVVRMKEVGFNPAIPIMVFMEGKKMIVVDGHHRLAAAKFASMPVYYVIVDKCNGMGIINELTLSWKMNDWLMHHVRHRRVEYRKVFNLVEEYGLGISLTINLAKGIVKAGGATQGTGKYKDSFKNGTYKVTDESLVKEVSNFGKTCAAEANIKAGRGLYVAYGKLLKLASFDKERLLAGVKSHPAALKGHGTVQQYLDAFEECYNFGRKYRIPLAFNARHGKAINSTSET